MYIYCSGMYSARGDEGIICMNRSNDLQILVPRSIQEKVDWRPDSKP